MAKRKNTPETSVEVPAEAAPQAATKPAPPLPPLRLEWRDPAELSENPKNWRRHPEAQLAALTDVISEVGWAGACLFNERTGRMIDGHGRKKVAVQQGCKSVPVLVGSWSEEDEAKILATLDPLAGFAEKDEAALDALLAEVSTESSAIAALLESLSQPAEGDQCDDSAENAEGGAGEDEIPERYQVLVELDDEHEQAKLLEELTRRGLKVRSLIS